MKSEPADSMCPTRSRLLGLVAAATVLASGCSGINPERIAPRPPSPSSSKIGTSVRVMDVTGSMKSTFASPRMIENEQFKEALILALRQSGIFSSVSAGRGDVELYAIIRSQGWKMSRGLEYTGTMVVTYKFLDHAGKSVWTASYESEFSSTAFAGATRTLRAREGSVRENLVSLLQGIREHWPRN